MKINIGPLICGEIQYYILATCCQVFRSQKIQSAFVSDYNDCPHEQPQVRGALFCGGQCIIAAHILNLGRTQIDRVSRKPEPNNFFPRPNDEIWVVIYDPIEVNKVNLSAFFTTKWQE